MKPLIRITGPLRCCLSLLQSRRRRRRRLDDPSPFPIVMILPFSSSKNVVVGLVEIIIRERKRKRKGPLNMASTGSILGFVEKAITGIFSIHPFGMFTSCVVINLLREIQGGRSGSCSGKMLVGIIMWFSELDNFFYVGRQHKSPPFAISWNHLHVSLPNSLTMILEDLIQTFSEVPKNINFVQRNNRLCWKFNKRGKPMIIDLGNIS
ncbi:hypothetical protein Ahy_B02g061113 isoform B [Arachis hypogaea]|uniref:Uncharacterized protein n=1 Tax=Arachis hypogaea TaxID=3818 RepID=A0A445AK42_ARAHY|nr:hypothetical protein Ahy_B02g061113 isoform B [Arachis hypogaea]